MTGHANGVITLDLDETDAAQRERRRLRLGEPYRTVLGHLRHEIAHYYQDILAPEGSAAREECRAIFGDDRDDYAAALERHYEHGAPDDWKQSHVSAYATMHPWEDWAETFAHYLHIRDTLQTAEAYGVRVDGPQVATTDDAPLHSDPEAPTPDIEALIDAWLPLTYALNAINRSMGAADVYPFVLTAGSSASSPSSTAGCERRARGPRPRRAGRAGRDAQDGARPPPRAGCADRSAGAIIIDGVPTAFASADELDREQLLARAAALAAAVGAAAAAERQAGEGRRGRRDARPGDVGDLLEHLPRDRREARTVATLTPGEGATVVVEVRSIGSRPVRRRGMKPLVEAVVADETGMMKATFFNQPWLAEQVPEGHAAGAARQARRAQRLPRRGSRADRAGHGLRWRWHGRGGRALPGDRSGCPRRRSSRSCARTCPPRTTPSSRCRRALRRAAALARPRGRARRRRTPATSRAAAGGWRSTSCCSPSCRCCAAAPSAARRAAQRRSTARPTLSRALARDSCCRSS